MNVEKMLNSLREHGTIDTEEGSFTLSLSEARQKLLQYQSSNPRRYLLMLVAGFQAVGCRAVKIVSDDFSYTLSFLEARVTQEALTEALAGHADEKPGVTDIALGIRTAFRCECHRVEFNQFLDFEEGFRWILTAEVEEVSSLEADHGSRVEMVFHFEKTWRRRATGIFRFLGGYVGRNEEMRLLQASGNRSRVPIVVDGETMNDRVVTLDSDLCATVGNCDDYDVDPDVVKSGYGWDGILTLERGSVELVRFGVTYSRLEGASLFGVVWHDGLKLDLSREGVLRDSTYERFLYELNGIRLDLLQSYFQDASLYSEVALEHLHDLVHICLTKNVPGLTHLTSSWMAKQFRDGRPPTTNKIELVGLYQALSQVKRGFKPRPTMTLDLCAAALLDRLPGVDDLLSDTATLIQENYPEDRLAAGYLLLGLGACLHNFGQPGTGKIVWQEALDTARDEMEPKNEELISAHLEFEPDHMMAEVAKALRIYAYSKKDLKL
jgi:hypothetical protein